MREINTILILGGYGNAGRCIAQHLVRETSSFTRSINIIIAGRDEDRAKQVAVQLGQEEEDNNGGRRPSNHHRIHWRRVDATDTNSLDAAFSTSSLSSTQQEGDVNNTAAAASSAAVVDMVIVASSTTSSAKLVAEAALRHHVDYYFDIQISSPSKIHDLTALEPQIKAADACFVTDGGVHPGVPGALVRYAAQKAMLTKNQDNTTSSAAATMTGVLSANVYIVFGSNWKEYMFSPATQKEFLDELGQMKPLLYKNGAWVDTGYTCTPTFDFGPPFGKHMCVPMFMQELNNIIADDEGEDDAGAPLPQTTMQELGVYIAGFNWFTDYIVLPLALLVLFIVPKNVSSWLVDPLLTWLFIWSLETFSKPPYGGKIVLEAVIGSTKYQTPQPQNDTVRLELYHHDVYEATAIPAVAAILQMLDFNNDKDNSDRSSSSSRPPPPGLHYQAQLVEPRRFLKDMQRLGMEIHEEATPIVSE